MFISRSGQDGAQELGDLRGHLPGQLEREFKGWRIIAFYSLGAKMYVVVMEKESDPRQVRIEIKSKGTGSPSCD